MKGTLFIKFPTLRHLREWPVKSSFISSFLVLFAASYIVIIPYVLICLIFTGQRISIDLNMSFTERSLIYVFMVGCVVAPFIEAFIFQYLTIRITRGIFKASNLTAIIVSSLIFGLSHFYNLSYMIYAFLIGVVLSSAFIARDHKGGRSFLMVIILHASRNVVSFAAWYFSRP